MCEPQPAGDHRSESISAHNKVRVHFTRFTIDAQLGERVDETRTRILLDLDAVLATGCQRTLDHGLRPNGARLRPDAEKVAAEDRNGTVVDDQGNALIDGCWRSWLGSRCRQGRNRGFNRLFWNACQGSFCCVWPRHAPGSRAGHGRGCAG